MKKKIQEKKKKEEIKRVMTPNKYDVDLSKDLWFTKQELLQKKKKKK